MEITIKGSEEELRVASEMIDQPALAAALDNEVVVRMGLHRPAEVIAVPQLDAAPPEPEATGLVFRSLKPGGRRFILAVFEGGVDGITAAALKRSLGVGTLGPAIGAVNTACQACKVAPQELYVTNRRGKRLRFRLTNAFAREVDRALTNES